MKLDRHAFKAGLHDAMTFAALRWWMFKRLSEFGWWICPEPHKTRLQAVMPTWAAIRQAASGESGT